MFTHRPHHGGCEETYELSLYVRGIIKGVLGGAHRGHTGGRHNVPRGCGVPALYFFISYLLLPRALRYAGCRSLLSAMATWHWGVGKRVPDSTRPTHKIIIPVIMAVRVYCPQEWMHERYANGDYEGSPWPGPKHPKSYESITALRAL